jgi:phosphonate transport system substrate-binding protein
MTGSREITLGAVAYHQRVVSIWESFRAYFDRCGVPTDYILFSTYERLVEAVLDGSVDIGWNTNTAFVALEGQLGEAAMILGMRDIDAQFATILVTRRGEAFEDPRELAGQGLALGSRDGGHTSILPLYYLSQQGLDAEAGCRLLRFDVDLGKHGDTGGSELSVVRAVAEGEARAGALGAPTWARFRAEGVPAVSELEVAWRSPAFYHCNFTALPSFDGDRGRSWQRALLGMSYDDPSMRPAMRLEGVRRWLPGGDRKGYASLAAAMGTERPTA